jgi:hypothetical protein
LALCLTDCGVDTRWRNSRASPHGTLRSGPVY